MSGAGGPSDRPPLFARLHVKGPRHFVVTLAMFE